MERLTKTLGMKEAITITVGTVVGVGLFTVGANTVGYLGPNIIFATLVAFIISILPATLYAEMGAAMPRAGGTYNFATKGVGRPFGIMAGWNFVISLVAVTSGEALAFSFYLKNFFSAIGISFPVDERIIAGIVVLLFVYVNYRGVKLTGKLQNGFVFFFWGCAIVWFISMIPHINMSYFTAAVPIGDGSAGISTFIVSVALVWWCFAGYETAVAMGEEIKYPEINIPRALIIAPILIFVVNAAFQWFLVGIVPTDALVALQTSEAPYADAMNQAGIIGIPLILLCAGIAFGGDFSTLNASVAAPSRYLFTMSRDSAMPPIFSKLHTKYKTPYIAVIFLGLLSIFLISTGSIIYIASLSLFADLFYYIMGFLGFIGLRAKFPDMRRPFKAPIGIASAVFSIVVYLIMMSQLPADGFITGAVWCILGIAVYLVWGRTQKGKEARIIADKIALDFTNEEVETPPIPLKKRMDAEFKTWLLVSVIGMIAVCLLYVWSFLR